MNREDVVSRVTSSGVQFIMNCIRGGYEDYNNSAYYGDAAKRDHTASVTAACINCHIVERAKRMSVEMQGFVRINQKRGRTTFILADHTEIWYKKLNKNGKPNFRVSQQALDYVEPPNKQLPMDIETPSEKMRWVAGYRSATGTDFEVLVSGPQEAGEWWEVRLSGSEIQELFPVPATTSIPAASTEVIKKRVHIRKTRESKVIGNEFDK